MEKSKHFKELEIILSSFSCDKGCPYCTAKITQWETVVDDVHMLSLYVGQLKELGYTFRYVTLGGNGEPTLHSYNKIKEIVELFDDYAGVEIKRVLTSGNVFRWDEKLKYELFKAHGWLFEVTTTDFEFEKSGGTQNYSFDYFRTEAFRKAPVRLNYVLLKDNIDYFVDDIKKFLTTYGNIQTVALKLLNVNTKTGKVDNKYSQWIVDNAIPKTDRESIKEVLDKYFEYQGAAFDTFSWLDKETNKEIYFSWKKSEYGLYDLVYYGDRFVTYQLEDASYKLDLLPKIYIAARFVKTKYKDGSWDLADDFRSKLIGDKKLFMNFNSHTFIKDSEGNYKYQFIGPFYNEKASTGDLTSTICEEVVRTESQLIDRCDIFMVYLNDTVSPGGIAELMYAVMQDKDIVIFYKCNSDIKYELKTENWYPITQVLQLSKKKVTVLGVKDEDEVISWFRSVGSSI